MFVSFPSLGEKFYAHIRTERCWVCRFLSSGFRSPGRTQPVQTEAGFSQRALSFHRGHPAHGSSTPCENTTSLKLAEVIFLLRAVIPECQLERLAELIDVKSERLAEDSFCISENRRRSLYPNPTPPPPQIQALILLCFFFFGGGLLF